MSKPKPNGLRILLAEDHASTRLGIKQILRDSFPRVVFGEAGDARETLTLLERDGWNLLILDISLPDRHGLDVLHEVKRMQPSLPVLIYSAHPEDQFAAHALRAGAAGYLTKERAPEELCIAVRIIVAGGKYISPSLVSGLAEDRTGLPHETLSKREFQVLQMTASGKTGKAIAGESSLDQRTVSTYRTRILKKLGLKSTAEMIRYAIRHELV